jgi:hypothetical protein
MDMVVIDTAGIYKRQAPQGLAAETALRVAGHTAIAR